MKMFEQMLVAKLNGERYDKVNSYFLGTVTEAYLSEVSAELIWWFLFVKIVDFSYTFVLQFLE